MDNALVRLIGWRALIWQGDPLVIDRWHWLKRHLMPGPQQTFDAGCGNGAFTLYAARIGNRAVGLSFSDRDNQKATTRAQLLRIGHVEFKTGDLRRLDEFSRGLGTFDQILCLETIEHIVNDHKLLHDLTGLLKPGGRLLLTTPYRDYRRLYGETLSESEDGGHVRWGYTHEELRALFTRCGLTVETEEFLCGVISQKVTDLMRRLSRINYRLAWALTLPLWPLTVLDPWLTRLTRYPHMTVGVVGVKVGGRSEGPALSTSESFSETVLR